ncbi:FtsQ-type POTRA domain-containing protein [Chitiniphilus purpureus]|uniref:Cell division protein FtsQ n=1 Tax=Chitiniphilus purpureus TaxID=2981137 RepID=A0ABY6DMK4_9NEIS|nr:FtsQ-type POTRA domain-containing protein [Chitiniphilus sp. CD1]UXY15582.1 FtsQ-type POTRA domain-containing protein [Chitiniphilus sp. CD1]
MWDKPQLLLWFANLLTGLAALLLFYSLVFLAVNSPLFPVKRIKVDGELDRVTREQLQYVIRNELKGTFFTLNLDKTRAAFEKLPWVRKVSVRRRWPDRLEVNIEEHVAIARWGSVALLNSYGERFDAASNDALPVLEGPAGAEQQMVEGYRALARTLKPIGKAPEHVWLSARRAWRMELNDGSVIEIGRDDALPRVARFVTAYPNSLALIAKTHPYQYVDLRYPNGFAVRLPGYTPAEPAKPRPQAAPRPAPAGAAPRGAPA